MRTTLLFLFLFSTLLQQGCVTMSVITAATISTKAVIDPRTIGTQADDFIIKLRVNKALGKDKKIKKDARVHVISYQGKIFLVGQAPNNDLRVRAKQIAVKIPGVTEVYNEIRKGNPISFCAVSSDTWITTKVYAKLLGSSKVKLSNVKINTENGEVFLFGVVTKDEGEAAANLASHIKGVKHVISAFSYIQ